MSIRSCAMQSNSFAKLLHAYENRYEAADLAREKGVKVIGELGCDVPDEYIIAAGMMPVRIFADEEKALIQTDRYLEYAFDPMVRAQFEKLVDGTYNEKIDALAISNSTDVIIRIFLYLQELKRVEPDKPVPPIAFIDWLFTRKEMHRKRNELTLGIFKNKVEEWAGRPITDEEIKAAANICNADRAALRKIQALRIQGRINGSEALVIIGSAFFMDRAEHAAVTEALAAEAASWPVIDAPRVFYTGSNQENTKLYDLIEAQGLLVVGEDHDWGARFFDRDYDTALADPAAVVDCYMFREFSSKKAFVSQRVEALNRQVKTCGAEGVIFYTNCYEESASWDYPSQKESLEAAGKKTTGLFKMQWPCNKNEGLEERLAAFAQDMKGGRNNG